MEVEKNKAKNVISIILFIGLIFLAYLYITDFSLFKRKENNTTNNNNNTTVKDYKENKIDKKKDYIYFENIDAQNVDMMVIYKDPIININSSDAKELTEKLANDTKLIRNSLVMATSEEDKELCESEVVSAKLKEYEIYEYEKYLTLVVYDYTYSCHIAGGERIPTSYVFDKSSGKLIKESDLLALYEIKLSDIKSIVKEKLNDYQKEISKNDEALINFILINDTLNNMNYNKNYTIYINKEGKLMINLIVLTEQVNYNETIEIK